MSHFWPVDPAAVHVFRIITSRNVIWITLDCLNGLTGFSILPKFRYWIREKPYSCVYEELLQTTVQHEHQVRNARGVDAPPKEQTPPHSTAVGTRRGSRPLTRVRFPGSGVESSPPRAVWSPRGLAPVVDRTVCGVVPSGRVSRFVQRSRPGCRVWLGSPSRPSSAV